MHAHSPALSSRAAVYARVKTRNDTAARAYSSAGELGVGRGARYACVSEHARCAGRQREALYMILDKCQKTTL